jgi:hypothetical protein
LQSHIFAETKNLFTLTQGGSDMSSKSPLFKVALLLVLVMLMMSITSGTAVLADGGGAQPFPPNQSPPSDGDASGNLLIVTLLTILQFVL